MKLPELAAGEQLAFPVLQQCEVASTDWSQAAADGEEEPEHPAPAIILTEATGDGHGHSAAPEEHDEAALASDDMVARMLGIGGLVLGTVGVLIGLNGRRKESK